MVHCIEQDSLKNRRSIYALGKLPLSAENCIKETLESCIRYCPTPFNVQSSRAVLLLGAKHNCFWDMVFSAIKTRITSDKIESTKNKIKTFQAAHGTILFYEDKKALADLKKQYPLYKKNMPVWTQQANGMLQYMVWQALSENDIGASLQHYNELIADDVSAWLCLPKQWEMVAQMPFGSIEKEAGEKTFLPIETRLKVFG